jgi:hypothetical protein
VRLAAPSGRVVVIEKVGNLGQSRLGLCDQLFQSLTKRLLSSEELAELEELAKLHRLRIRLSVPSQYTIPYVSATYFY